VVSAPVLDLDLSGQHALVCGGTEGIGRASAVLLAAHGADVTVLSRTAATLEATVAALPRPREDQAHAFIEADMSDLAALSAKVEALANARPVTILVHNSGGPPGGPAHAAGLDAYEAAFRQHLLAGQTLLQAVLPGMRRARFGRIVNVISTSVKEPIRGLGVSNTIRAAIAAWSKTLAAELGPFGITVNNVLPGYTRTRRLEQIVEDRMRAAGKLREEIEQAMLATVPAGRFAEPGEVAAAVLFLASPAAAYVNGINLPVDGGRMQSL
jgi:3-oxoacyl-[acyl-carrier protein] reductase